MPTMLDTPAPVTTVADDPKRPVKAIVAACVAVAITVVQAILEIITEGQTWTTEDTLVTILAFLGAVAVYVADNPKIVVRSIGAQSPAEPMPEVDPGDPLGRG